MTARCRTPEDCDDRHCVVCSGHLADIEPQSCVECLGRVRRDLLDVLEMFALLPDELGHATAAPLDAGSGSSGEPSLPGGDVLALLAPGSPGSFWREREGGSTLGATPWRPVQRLRHEPVVWSSDVREQAEQAAKVTWASGSVNPHLASDAPSVAHELGTWEDDWRSERGEPAAPGPATVVGSVDYLSRRAGWAADKHPAFDEFVSDVARLRSRLEVATSLDSRPLVSAEVTCLKCETDGIEVHLRRSWTDEGLSDEWRCPRCRTGYSQQEFWVALHSALEDKRRDQEAKNG